MRIEYTILIQLEGVAYDLLAFEILQSRFDSIIQAHRQSDEDCYVPPHDKFERLFHGSGLPRHNYLPQSRVYKTALFT